MIHYIGYYVDESDEHEYSHNVPGLKKMQYVADVLKSTGDELSIFSVCKKKHNGVFASKKLKTDEGYNLVYRATSCGGFFNKVLDKILLKRELHRYIKNIVKENDTVVVYHSVNLTRYLSKYLHKKSIQWILEVEELYGYGASFDNPHVDKEIEDIKKFPKHIFVNNVLPEFFGITENYTVCYGSYSAKKRPMLPPTEKVRVVYAGTIEESKIGAYTAAEAARFLPDSYEMHIAGFGSDVAITRLKEMIDENNRLGRCQIIYHGKLDGEELSNLLFSCEIGLSTYVIRLPFSNCVFPSKLTTYVCHGLKVVIGRSENFEKAEIAQGWTYYEENDPKSISQAIEQAHSATCVDGYELICRLDEEFRNWLKKNISKSRKEGLPSIKEKLLQ